jgi:hypothetical protein
VKTNTNAYPPGYAVRKGLVKTKENAKALPGQWLKL